MGPNPVKTLNARLSSGAVSWGHGRAMEVCDQEAERSDSLLNGTSLL